MSEQNVFLENTIAIYSRLLEETAKNKFYIGTIDTIRESLENLEISEEKKSRDANSSPVADGKCYDLKINGPIFAYNRKTIKNTS